MQKQEKGVNDALLMSQSAWIYNKHLQVAWVISSVSVTGPLSDYLTIPAILFDFLTI